MKYRRQRLPSLERRRRRRAVAVLPTLFTLGNCLCGFASLHYAAKGDVATTEVSNYAIAGYLIFAAMVFDLLDGRMARLARATSDFGGELDSLADMLSFGVAPAFLTLSVISQLLSGKAGMNGPFDLLGPATEDKLGRLFWIIGAIYVSCTALRLARFNVRNKHAESAHMAFEGLPSPGAAGVVASTIICFETLQPSARHFVLWAQVNPATADFLVWGFPYAMPALLLTMALLMVSRFNYAHVINQYLRGRRPFSYVVRIVIVVLALCWQPQITALAVIYIYAFSAPVAWVYRSVFRRQQRASAALELDENEPNDVPFRG